MEETSQSLREEQLLAIFEEFDTSGDGFIDVGELQAALGKAGKEVSLEEAGGILKRVDANNDGQISFDEFKAALKGGKFTAASSFFDVSSFFMNIGDALGIETRGQWRTTASGSKFVDDVLGSGRLVAVGDIVKIQYTVTLMSTGAVVESSRNGGPALGFQLGEPSGSEQGWNDAVYGMRVGGQRRVYATPPDGEGATARYDIEVVDVEAATEPTAQEKVITSLGGRRAAARLLFALTFVPYFLPEEYQPAFFKADYGGQPVDAETSSKKVDKKDEYVASQLDALFANEELPSGKRK